MQWLRAVVRKASIVLLELPTVYDLIGGFDVSFRYSYKILLLEVLIRIPNRSFLKMSCFDQSFNSDLLDIPDIFVSVQSVLDGVDGVDGVSYG